MLSSRDEPASTGGNELVPEVAAWQEAADSGADAHREAQARASAGSGQTRPPGPPWTPASAALPAALRTELIDWLRGGLPNEGCGVLIGARRGRGRRGALALRGHAQHGRLAVPLSHGPRRAAARAARSGRQRRDRLGHRALACLFATGALDDRCWPGRLSGRALSDLFVRSPRPELRGWTIVDGAVNEVVLEPV